MDAKGFAGLREVADWTPPTIDAAYRDALDRALDAYDEALAPGDYLLIAGRVHTLLAHWRDREIDEPTRDAITADWLSILGGYPLWVVHEAAAEWLALDRLRPTIADIRRLCDQAVRSDQLRMRLLRRMAAASVPVDRSAPAARNTVPAA